MKYTIAKQINETETLTVKIRLDDECRNDCSYFSITGDLRENDIWSAGGYMHDEIIKYCPELQIFVDLHLSDCNGVPISAVANGMFHFKKSIDQGSKYLRLGSNISNEDKRLLQLIAMTDNNDLFYSFLVKLGVYEAWRLEARGAIKQLETLTGSQFGTLTPRDNYNKLIPTDHIIAHGLELILKNNYDKAMEEEKKQYLQKVKDERIKLDKDILIKLAILEITLNRNWIYYRHTNMVELNRMSYGDKFPIDKIEELQKLAKILDFTVEL